MLTDDTVKRRIGPTREKKLATNLERYRADLKNLVDLGFNLELRMQFDLYPTEVRKQLKEGNKLDDKQINEFIKKLPSFKGEYQKWYSEASALIRQIMPDRLSDFTALYMAPASRKEIKFGNYVLHDYLQGLSVTRGLDTVVGPSAALPQFRIQRNILEAAERRFESSLFDIISLAQADLLDDEIQSARLLLKGKFTRAAGAIAGVVLEKHLKSVITSTQSSCQKLNQRFRRLMMH